jgi:polysaccharide export outer membrane protein
MTVPEVVEALKKAYSGVLRDPIIHVALIDFQRPFFLASGQVGRPGQYDLRHETTVSEAIAMAGGFAPTAKTQVFFSIECRLAGSKSRRSTSKISCTERM